ncbi:MAG TPA: peptidoglycan-binding domain-containing protein [Myxococcales bacterium]|nr:peptidoglycan-binding domain-containing protein [Myxococcales bacterium]
MRTLACALALLLAGCVHTTHVEKPDDQGGAEAQAQPAPKEGGAAAQPQAARRPEKPGRPPLAAAPGALFVPAGVEEIQKALASRGYLDLSEAKAGEIDAATSAAVRKFQSDEGIARTGNPDHETVRRLGLDADALFRKSSAVKEGSGSP